MSCAAPVGTTCCIPSEFRSVPHWLPRGPRRVCQKHVHVMRVKRNALQLHTCLYSANRYSPIHVYIAPSAVGPCSAPNYAFSYRLFHRRSFQYISSMDVCVRISAIVASRPFAPTMQSDGAGASSERLRTMRPACTWQCRK